MSSSARSKSRKSNRTLLAATALAGLLMAGAIWGWQHWKESRPPTPPSVPVATLDPVLQKTVETSRQAVLTAPKSASAWGKLGETFHAAEFYAQARSCYSNAAALDASSFRWPYLLGLLELQDDPDRAIRRLHEATQLALGKSEAPRFQLARALVERGRYGEAEPHLRTLLASNPNHAAAHLELARVFLARNDLREATRQVQPALSNAYTMRAALQLVAQMAQRNDQPDVAASMARRAVSIPRGFDWPDPVLREVQGLRLDRARMAEQANSFLQQQKLSEAGALLGRLLNAFPEDPEGLLLLGRLRFLEKRCPEAESVLRKFLSLQTNSLNGMVQLGLALHCQQRWPEAIAVLERVVELKPDFAQAHVNLATARSQHGDVAGAIRSYRDALRSNPGDINAHMALAQELANAGDTKGAAEHVARAAVINPNDPRIKPAREQLGIQK